MYSMVSCSVMSDSLWPHGPQHAGLPLSITNSRSLINSCPLRQWCHPTISSSVIPFSSCIQSLPALGSFPMSQLFASGGQNIGASALASLFPMNIQGWFPLGLTGLISLQSKGLSRVFSSITPVEKHQLFGAHPSLSMVCLSHPHMTTRKTIALIIWTLSVKWCPCFSIRCLGLS